MTQSETRKHVANRRIRRGFTLIEVLMVVAIIAVLVGLLIVALNKVRGTGERASTEKLMQSIDAGLSQFNADHGFFPPLLDDTIGTGGGGELQPYPVDRSDDVDYYSVLTLAPYLMGVGDLNGDGDVDQYDDGLEGAGFRDPGPDRAWGYAYRGTNGNGRAAYWTSKEKLVNQQRQIPGKTYGPYVQVSGDRQVAVGKNRAGVPFDRDVRPLFVINDFWGGSIRYYRNWPKVLPQGERLEDHVPVWFGSLAADQVESFRMQARSVEYVLMSEGPDTKAKNNDIDAAENRDNIVRAQS